MIRFLKPGDAIPAGEPVAHQEHHADEDVKPTTERCPACWGNRYKDPPGWPEDPWCEACDGAGKCDPIRARGKQRLWEWAP